MKILTSSILCKTKSQSITSPHNLEMSPTQQRFFIGKPQPQKENCLGCCKMGYKSCECHLVAQHKPLPRPEDASIFIPDDKGTTSKTKRKYAQKSDEQKDKLDKTKRKYTKKNPTKIKMITLEQPKNPNNKKLQ